MNEPMKKSLRRRRGHVVVVIGTALGVMSWGCAGESDTSLGRRPSSAAGAEGSPCTNTTNTGGGCATGLACVSNVCVASDAIMDGGVAKSDGSAPVTDASDAGASDAGAADAPFDAAACAYQHPLVDAGARYCGAGRCYCAAKDSCYATASAADCCENGAVVCY